MKKRKTSRPSIAIVICYFGKLPWYFDYYVHSCSYNPSVDVYVIIDDTSYTKRIPSNIKIINATLTDVSRLASEKLGFEICIQNAYKLCDFKPAYGVIFGDLLKKYDFWAFGDIDVIYGNIRNFLTETILGEFDLISVRPDWIPGCFLLFRNEPKMNSLFKMSKDYRKVFTSTKHFCFDETNFAHDAFTEGQPYTDVITEIESMMHVVKRAQEDKLIKPYFDLHIVDGLPGRIKWVSGKLTYRDKYEILLYHLIRLKRIYKPAVAPHQIPAEFNISPTRVYW